MHATIRLTGFRPFSPKKSWIENIKNTAQEKHTHSVNSNEILSKNKKLEQQRTLGDLLSRDVSSFISLIFRDVLSLRIKSQKNWQKRKEFSLAHTHLSNSSMAAAHTAIEHLSVCVCYIVSCLRYAGLQGFHTLHAGVYYTSRIARGQVQDERYPHCCKTEHYYPSTPLPGRGARQLKGRGEYICAQIHTYKFRLGEGVVYGEQDAVFAKTQSGKPRATIPARAIDSDTTAFQLRQARDLSTGSCCSTSILIYPAEKREQETPKEAPLSLTLDPARKNLFLFLDAENP